MAAPIIIPGTTQDVPSNGTVAPSDSSYTWEVWDVINNVRVASSTAPNGWNVTLDSNTPRGANVTEPSGVSQGGDTSPLTTGRYEWRTSSALNASS